MALNLERKDRRYTSVASVDADLVTADQIRTELIANKERHQQQYEFWSLIAHRLNDIEKAASVRLSPDEWASRNMALLQDDQRQLDEINMCIGALARVKFRLEDMFAEAAQKSE